jgi:hypothetical protein
MKITLSYCNVGACERCGPPSRQISGAWSFTYAKAVSPSSRLYPFPTAHPLL